MLLDLEQTLKRNLETLLEKVERACAKAGRKKDEVKILGASKGQSEDKIRILYRLGIKTFGENYIQEAEKKVKNLADLKLDWHFIGRLQTNKVKKAVTLFSTVHSLDRIALAEELNKRSKALNKKIKVLVEVNLGAETSKAGLLEDEVEDFIERVLPYEYLEVVGLMCLPPLTEDKALTRTFLRRMKELFEKLKPKVGESFTELSMGTSSDFELAIEEGATIIRIGTLLFGQRR